MESTHLKKNNKGFSLIEIMVVIGIVGLLASVIGINALESGQQSRDAKRQADLKTLQAAIELYKNKYGRYPDQCAQANAGLAQGWSGQQGTNYACSGGGTQYIIGHVDVNDLDGDGDTTDRLTFTPEFIPVLPVEKKLNGINSGYVYRTNTNGTVYKLMAMNTVESERLDTVRAYLHPMKSCDMRARLNTDDSVSELAADSWCNYALRSGISTYGQGDSIAHCKWDDSSNRFQRSYGAWGGFAPATSPAAINSEKAWTQQVICQ